MEQQSLDVNYLSNLTEEFMDKNAKNLNWNNICSYQKLSEKFMEKHVDKLNWKYVCVFQKLSENFMEKYVDKLDWQSVCLFQNLSEEFMEKHIDKLHWNIISYLYKLKNPIFEKYIRKENNWLYLKEKEKISALTKYYKIIEKDGIKYVECYKKLNKNKNVNVNALNNIKENQFVFDKLNYKYETICDYNPLNTKSNGFECCNDISVICNIDNWTDYKIIKCLLPLDDVCMMCNGNIRSSSLIIIKLYDDCRKFIATTTLK
jgi:hypothetical protein